MAETDYSSGGAEEAWTDDWSWAGIFAQGRKNIEEILPAR